MFDEPAGLYVHVPYCSVVCPYCDFAVRPGRPWKHRRYVDHLVDEVRLVEDWDASIDSIFLGGGTPSALEPADLERILGSLRSHLPVRDDARITMEANPEDVTPEAAAAWRELGVDTLSLGVQSMDETSLKRLGRRHDPERARLSVGSAREAGFSTVSLDLIYGLPHQSADDWERDLHAAADLEPDHVSCYQLTIHGGTGFGIQRDRGQLVELPSDEQAAMFFLTHSVLEQRGYHGYEVSNFASAPEHRSRHNLKYWHHVPYLGLGPSAHSFDGTRRWWNVRDVDAWQEAVASGRRPVAGSEHLSPDELAIEALMLGLRTHAGVDLDDVQALCGTNILERNAELLRELSATDLVTTQGHQVLPTLAGLAVADSLAARFDVG